MEEVWKIFLKDFADVELYIKTTGADIPEELGSIVRSNNWIIDNRKLNIKDLVKLYHSAHAMVFLHLGEGYGLCVDPNTLIQIPNGVKLMNDITIGDYVMSEDGNFNLVKNKISRHAECKEFKITSAEKLIVTNEHPFLAIRRNNKSFKTLRKSTLTPTWIRADQLSKGDLVAYPRPKWTNDLPKILDLVDFADNNLKYDNNYVWYKMGFSSKKQAVSISEVIEKYDITKRVAEDALCLLRKRGRSAKITNFNKDSLYPKIAAKIKQDFEFINKDPIKYTRYIPLDNQFLEFIGWYLAEGSWTHDGISLAFHKKEEHIANRIGKYLSTFGFTYLVTIEVDTNRCELTVSGKPLVNLVKRLCGTGAIGKEIHEIFWKASDKISWLLNGYFNGDGNNTEYSWRATSISKNLIYQIKMILSSVGIHSSVQRRPARNSSKEAWILSISGQELNKFCSFTNLPLPVKYNFKKRTGSHSIVTNDFIYVPIDSIKNVGIKEVMDISVEKTHSFVGNGIILHNTALEAMATQMPLVVSNHTGTLDFCNKTNSFPVSVDMGKIQVLVGKGGDVQTKEIDAGIPSIVSAMTQMANVMYKYDKASDIARQAVKDARKLTWENAAKRLKEILEILDSSSSNLA